MTNRNLQIESRYIGKVQLDAAEIFHDSEHTISISDHSLWVTFIA
jgi:hypothetical protein